MSVTSVIYCDIYNQPSNNSPSAPDILCPQTQLFKPSARNRTFGAESVFESLNSLAEEFTLDDLGEISNQSALETAEKPEPESGPGSA